MTRRFARKLKLVETSKARPRRVVRSYIQPRASSPREDDCKLVFVVTLSRRVIRLYDKAARICRQRSSAANLRKPRRSS